MFGRYFRHSCGMQIPQLSRPAQNEIVLGCACLWLPVASEIRLKCEVISGSSAQAHAEVDQHQRSRATGRVETGLQIYKRLVVTVSSISAP